MSPLVDKTTTTAAVVNGTAHIPAWKRIGLKLKYAADTPAPIPIPAAHVPSKKRKHYDSSDSDDEAETRKVTKKKKAKKQKVLEEDEGKKTSKKERRQQQQQQQDQTFESTQESTPPPPPTPSRLSISPTKSLLKKTKDTGYSSSRRKSVTFASDVKATDGDSIKQLYLALDPFGKNRTRGGMTPAVNTSTHTSAPSKPLEEKINTTSLPKKAAAVKQKHRGGSNNNGSSKPYLDYLSNFHLHRTFWKFEKVKQNWVLKNALDPGLIAESHEKALAVYVAGLQGAGARDRLLEEAKKVLKDQNEPRLARAKLIAKALGRKGLTRDESDSSSSSSSSSSESSESESDSGSDSDDDSSDSSDSSDDAKTAAKPKATAEKSDSDSSDSDSSSSSESEDSSDDSD
jgi:hypothetical protein